MKELLAILLISSGVAMATPTIYQEQNFSIEYPDGWQEADAPPKALALFRSPDGKKGIVIMAFRVPVGDSVVALRQMIAGAKDAAAKKGAPITGEQDLSINGTTFHSYRSELPGNVATFSNSAITGDWGYSVQGVSGISDPATDPEIQKTLNSFRLLSPVVEAPVSDATAKPESAAYKAGELTGRIAIAAFAVGALVIVIKRRLEK